ncbi:MAG: HD domain-containing protein [Oscillospiraceae bacterium]|jgi:predicted amidohydrolase/5'-deoxynucleotidase YfbR-like HD superfamily hydrolase|nr:HD domain-containing protein [Oscillospiraceae bacterium]
MKKTDVDNIVFKEVSLNSKKLSDKIIFVIAQPKFSKKKNNESKEFIKYVENVLDIGAKSNLVVFPEYSITSNLYPKILEWSKKNDAIVIAGTDMFEECGLKYNRAAIIFNGLLHYTEKTYASPHETDVGITTRANEQFIFTNTPVGKLCILICHDISSPKNLFDKVYLENPDVICVIAYQNDAFAHHNIIRKEVKKYNNINDMGVYIIYSNSLSNDDPIADGRSAFFAAEHRSNYYQGVKDGYISKRSADSQQISNCLLEMIDDAGLLRIEAQALSKVPVSGDESPDRNIVKKRQIFKYVDGKLHEARWDENRAKDACSQELKPQDATISDTTQNDIEEQKRNQRQQVAEEVQTLCFEHLKNSTKAIIVGSKRTEPLESITLKAFLNMLESPRLDAVETILSMIVKVRDIKADTKTAPPSNVFRWFTETVCNSRKTIPIIVKGNPTLGKSTFMGLFYIFILEQFVNGKIDYVPFYYNNESAIKRSSNDEDVGEAVNRIAEFFKATNELANRLNIPALYVFDGLTNSTSYKNVVEEFVQNIEQQFKGSNNKDKLIYIIDEFSNRSSERYNIGLHEDVDYVMYFNNLDAATRPASDMQTFLFINAYAKLYSLPDIITNNAVAAYNELMLQHIDFNIVSTFEDELFRDNRNIQFSLGTLYERYARRKLSNRVERYRDKVAYRMYKDASLSYWNYKNDVTISDFKLLSEQSGLLQYLVAACYIEKLLGSLRGKPPEILNILFDKFMAVLIVDMLSGKTSDKVSIHIRRAFDKLDFKGRSSLSYLVGRLEIDGANDILASQEKKLIEIGVPASHPDIDYYYFARRSVFISKINISTNEHASLDAYLEFLFQDSYQCRINRVFYRLYYKDITLKELKYYDKVQSRFDFHFTYHNIANRLHSIENKKSSSRYTLLEIDLFTVCNLFQVRIEKQWVELKYSRSSGKWTKTDSRDEVSFLYKDNNKEHLQHLEKVVNWVSIYLEHYMLSESSIAYQALISYFELVSDMFQEFLSKVNTSRSELRSPLIKWLERSHNLFSERRIGWNIPHNNKLNLMQINKIKETTPVVETVAEHILSTYLIGLLYLPDKIDDIYAETEYNKQEILNTILIHDLGEAEVGDYPPQFDGYDEIQQLEDDYLSKLFQLGTFEENGSLFSYYRMWKSWRASESGVNINIKIAIELDKIQMIYRFLKLVEENRKEVCFNAERKESFLNEYKKIKTPVGKMVLYQLFLNNSEVAKHFTTNSEIKTEMKDFSHHRNEENAQNNIFVSYTSDNREEKYVAADTPTLAKDITSNDNLKQERTVEKVVFLTQNQLKEKYRSSIDSCHRLRRTVDECQWRILLTIGKCNYFEFNWDDCTWSDLAFELGTTLNSIENDLRYLIRLDYVAMDEEKISLSGKARELVSLAKEASDDCNPDNDVIEMMEFLLS